MNSTDERKTAPKSAYDIFIDNLTDRIVSRITPLLGQVGTGSPTWMSVKEAAKHFGVGKTTIREAVAAKTIPHTYIQGRLIILVDEVRKQAQIAVRE